MLLDHCLDAFDPVGHCERIVIEVGQKISGRVFRAQVARGTGARAVHAQQPGIRQGRHHVAQRCTRLRRAATIDHDDVEAIEPDRLHAQTLETGPYIVRAVVGHEANGDTRHASCPVRRPRHHCRFHRLFAHSVPVMTRLTARRVGRRCLRVKGKDQSEPARRRHVALRVAASPQTRVAPAWCAEIQL